ncbi:hypothetical protein ACOMHN_037461 [Nucella lapillus]
MVWYNSFAFSRPMAAVFSSCVSDVSECLSLAVGQYPFPIVQQLCERRERVPVSGVFGECLADASYCVALSKSQGQYPLCSDCSGFVKCAWDSSARIPCPSGTEYDYILGVCNHIGTATCYE